MLIGGAQLYGQGLVLAERLYLTRVELSPEGDAWFPDIDQSDWRLASSVEHPATAETPFYAFEVWERVEL
jgi:dihydrofolate reductase